MMKRGGTGTIFRILESEKPLFNIHDAFELYVRITTSFDWWSVNERAVGFVVCGEGEDAGVRDGGWVLLWGWSWCC
jgi:hypothetical protein